MKRFREREREISSHLFIIPAYKNFMPIAQFEDKRFGQLIYTSKKEVIGFRNQSTEQLRPVQLSLHQQNFFFCFSKRLDILFKSSMQDGNKKKKKKKIGFHLLNIHKMQLSLTYLQFASFLPVYVCQKFFLSYQSFIQSLFRKQNALVFIHTKV